MLVQTGFVLLQTGFEIKIKIGVSVGCHRKQCERDNKSEGGEVHSSNYSE